MTLVRKRVTVTLMRRTSDSNVTEKIVFNCDVTAEKIFDYDFTEDKSLAVI